MHAISPKFSLALCLLFLLLIGTASAGVINIGNGASGSDPTGTVGTLDPVLIGNGSDLSIEVQGSASITDQVLLTILVPNDPTDLFGATDPLGTITTYSKFPGPATGTGSSAFVGTGFGLGTCGKGKHAPACAASYLGDGFWGDLSTASNTDLGAFLDSEFNSSNNTPNFVGFDNSLSVPSLSNVADFGVYTFAITTGPLAPSKGGSVGLVNVAIPGNLPDGSIAIALDDSGDSTVWTNAGGVNIASTPNVPPPTPIPEPSSILLVASGLCAFVKIQNRRTR